MSDYPVQIEKVQAPPLRDETLARDRLLDWLHVKIHRRVVLVLAEAGYGKTTLLADFSRRTRVRVSWYRLDRGDRDWLGFIAHLVAAFQVHQPEFGPVTASMIREASGGTMARDTVLDTFIRELGTLAAEPAALVLDDFHLVDDSQEARVIVRELLARAPERVTFVLISRTMPSLPLARLRSLGEVVELHKHDLRFAQDETERLFRETYALDLERSVVTELARRTEGWVASLELVRAAIRERNPSEIRSFVRSLSGAEGNLYDYLAEEVVGELSGDLQQFLMRTSLLETIEPVLGTVAAQVPVEQTRASIADGEMIGLFSRLGPNTRDHVRAHPLVRDFLEARLRRSVGAQAVIEIHRAVAVAAESMDWRIAGHHYLEAGDLDDARRVLASAIETILATGAYAAAETLVTALPATDRPDPNVLVILSRLAQQRGDLEAGRNLATEAHDADPDSLAAVLNLQSALMNAGDIDAAVLTASLVESREEWGAGSRIARATRLLLETSTSGALQPASEALLGVIDQFSDLGRSHYAGVAHLSLGSICYAEARADEALEHANEAISHLKETSAGQELVSARLLRALALAHLGRIIDARAETKVAADATTAGQSFEVALESAAIEALYGDPRRVASLLRPHVSRIKPTQDVGEQAVLISAFAAMSLDATADAEVLISSLDFGNRRSTVAMESMRLFARAALGVLIDSKDCRKWSAAAYEHARSQGATLWEQAALVLSRAQAPEKLSETVEALSETDPTTLTIAADALGVAWPGLTKAAIAGVSTEVRRRPERWRPVLRRAVVQGTQASRAAAGSLLDEVGELEDVARLRQASRDLKGLPGTRDLGRALARRLAKPVWISDLGRVEIHLGRDAIDGSRVRRKVLSFLCFLLSRRQMSATREEVLEALWPDLDPSTALNSLNQTVYFLRRVFEPEYQEDTSPGYMGQDGELVWLDPDLIGSQSRLCRDMIRALPGTPDAGRALELARAYTGRFAIDFTYEEWAADYRDSLHASYLRVAEAAIRADLNSGHYDRGVELAQLAADVEPDAEEIQVGLVRLLRMSGATAAASERYQRYARSQRDLGVEPEPFERL